jgi:hypothetical protein
MMRRLLQISAILFIVCAPAYLRAQDDDVSLGDLARALRNSKPPEETDIIDNDNLDRIMDKAESQRLEGQPVFSITHTGALVAVSEDGACSLSFDSRSLSRNSAAYITADLPQSELIKLEGPAAIQDGTLQVSIHNGTRWELKEIVVGLTLTQAPSAPPEYRLATLQSVPIIPSEKLPDSTTLYHLRGNALPNSTSTFRASLEDSSEATTVGKDWHWSIVGARGIPPAAQALTANGSSTAPGLVDPTSAVRAETIQAGADQTATSNPSVTTSPGPAQQ